MISSSAYQSAGHDSFTDLSSLHSITAVGREDKQQALEKIAEQFESMMLRMMMKSMRDANEVFAEGNMLSSHEGDTYQQMFDDQLALSLSQGNGMGIAEVMVKQLQQRYAPTKVDGAKPAANIQDYLQRPYQGPAQVSGLSSSLAQQDHLDALSITTAAANTDASTDGKHTAAAAEPMSFDGSPEMFVEKLYPLAQKAAAKLGVEPEILIAQAALETGWGAKITSLGEQSSQNLFNIKADSRWQGSYISVPTLEVRNGTAVREIASFRAYDSPQHSFEDYANFISQSPRYEQALQADSAEEYIQALADAGYATDPQYGEKVMRIYNSANLQTTGSLSVAMLQ